MNIDVELKEAKEHAYAAAWAAAGSAVICPAALLAANSAETIVDSTRWAVSYLYNEEKLKQVETIKAVL